MDASELPSTVKSEKDMSPAEMITGKLIEFVRKLDADDPKPLLGDKFSDIVDAFSENERDNIIFAAEVGGLNRAKAALLFEVVPHFSGLGGGGIVEKIQKIIEYSEGD